MKLTEDLNTAISQTDMHEAVFLVPFSKIQVVSLKSCVNTQVWLFFQDILKFSTVSELSEATQNVT